MTRAREGRTTFPLAQRKLALIRASKHVIKKEKRRWWCTVCCQGTGKRYRWTWLKSGPCSGKPSSRGTQLLARACRGVGMETHPALSIGLQHRFHLSHNLDYHRGIYWCWKCGCYATQSPRMLKNPCNGSCTDRGRKGFLSRLRKGLPPKAGMEWPLPADS